MIFFIFTQDDHSVKQFSASTSPDIAQIRLNNISCHESSTRREMMQIPNTLQFIIKVFEIVEGKFR